MTQSATIVKSSGSVRVALFSALAALAALTTGHCGGEQVPAQPGLPLPRLALSPSNPQIAQGTGQQFSLRGLYDDGRIRELTEQVEWRVVDGRGRALATAPDGLLQVEEPGRYLVTARYRGQELTTPMVVTAATVTSVAISPTSPRVAKGLTQAFTAVATFSDATTQDVTKLATWAVKDVVGSGVATIDTTGLLSAKSIGKATITARYKLHSRSTTVEVVDAVLNKLLVAPADPTIAKGTSIHFTATGLYSDGSSVDVTASATWAVTDVMGVGVAAIDGTGTANGTGEGQALVSADFGGLTAETSLNVSPATAVSIAISPATASIPKGTSQRFLAIATLTDGSTQDVSAATAWTSSDRSGSGVASIDGTGLAKGNALGTATITGAYKGNTATASLEVTAAVLSSLAVSPASVSIYKGQYVSLAAIGTYSDGSTQDLSASATWTAGDLSGTDVASVAAGGQVFGKNIGKAKVAASVGALSGSAVVDVATPVYTGLSVSPTSTVGFRGLAVQFNAIATLPDGTTQDVTASATWTATDYIGTGVASVSSRGLVTPLATGMAYINAAFGGFSSSGSLIVLF